MKVLVTDGLAKEGIEKLLQEGFDVVSKKLDHEELLKEISDYDALIVKSATKVSADVINAAKKLKIVGRAGVGTDNIDGDAATEEGIIVKSAPHGGSNSVAELTIGLMFALSRNISQAYASLKIDKKWEKKKYEGTELSGKTLGIIGCGRIGRRVAHIAKHGLDMNVIGFDVFPIKEYGIYFVSMEEILERSDYITLHAPKQKKAIIGEEELNKMKKTAYLINTSRGSNVDEEALYYALKEKKIAGAAFDIYTKEAKDGQHFENKLFELENFIGTSHLGASTKEGQSKTAVEMADVIINFLKEGDWTNAINIGKEIEMEKKPTYNLFVTHANVPGMFGKIADTFGKYKINLIGLPSRIIGDKAITIFKAQQEIDNKIINEIRSIEGIYRVTF